MEELFSATNLIAGSAAIIALASVVFTVAYARQQHAQDALLQYLQGEAKFSKKFSDKVDTQLWLLLVTAQSVLRAYPFSAGWRALMKDQLKVYRRDLIAWNKTDTAYVGLFGRKVKSLVHEVIDEGSRK